MALLNPVYAFVVPFLFVVTVPLAVFAGITTTVAFSVLILRVLAVYIDVALSFVPHYLGGRKIHQYSPRSYRPHHHLGDDAPAPGSLFNNTIPSSSSSAALESSLRRRRQRPSSSALSAAGTATPVSEKGFGIAPSIGPERDFEGVGGWRLGGDDDTWTTINSRLELPDKQHHGRNHHRSPSGPTTPGEGGYLMMKGRTRSPEAKRSSPNSSRTRTPSGPRVAFGSKSFADGYFPSLKTSPKGLKRLPAQGLVDA
ncbi:hypothetical protein FZEAL_1686 [Fusarium zealandicum]|uniref:Uncharacterized protein n=1 Tax=Fusarium zealandicum TaxID=1053134 RepID=A0A8H4XPN0_9HYPO|nr:hypothetical protein FZEAL_1686 [Fusarium zealandicum]